MRVGLTGGVASGKSTVSAIFDELGAVIIDGDLIAREVVAKGTPGLAAVIEAFGEELLTADGELDRTAMGSIVFHDEAKRKQLEGIVHPLIFERYAELEAAAGEDDPNDPNGHAGLVIHDIPLLAESGRAEEFDEVVVVDVPEEVQVARMLRDRGWTEEDARSRIGSQATRAERSTIATHVIENSGDLEQLRDRVIEVHAALLGPR